MNLAIARLQEVLDKQLKEEAKFRNEVDWAYEAYQRALKTLEIQQEYVDELRCAIKVLEGHADVL